MLAQPGRTFSQLSNLSFAQPCSKLLQDGNDIGLIRLERPVELYVSLSDIANLTRNVISTDHSTHNLQLPV